MLLRFIAWTGQLGRLFLLPVSHHILCRSFEALSLLSPFYMDVLVFRCSLPFAHEGPLKCESLWRRELVNWKKCALHVVADAQGKRRGSLCSWMPPRMAIKTVYLPDRDNPEILRVKN